MTKRLILSIICLHLMCGCASTHTLAVASCPKPAPLSPELKVPAPLPEEFSKCLREIIAVGNLQQAQISAECSAFLHNGLTKPVQR